VPDVAAFLSAVFKGIPNRDKIEAKQFRDLGKQSKRQAADSRRKVREERGDRPRLDPEQESAEIKKGIEEAVSWQVPTDGPEVTIDEKGRPYVHGVDNSEEGLRKEFGDDATDTYFLLIEQAHSRGFELEPLHVMLALAGREGMRKSLEENTWFQMLPQTRKTTDVDLQAQAIEMLQSLQERVGGLGGGY